MGISVVIARGILSEIQRRGLNPDELLRLSDIDGTRLLDIREVLHTREAEVLVQNAIRMTGDPGLGLAIGSHAPENMLQVFGHLILSHRTIREACAALKRYAPLIVDGPTLDLVEQGDVALFTFTPHVQLGDVTRCFVDGALALTARIGEQFSGSSGRLIEVRFQHERPSYEHRYHAEFDCPVYFGQEMNALVFSRDLLDRQQPHADDTMRTVLRETAERLLEERSRRQSITERVRTLLRYEPSLAVVDAERIARRIGLSERALRRQLGAEGAPLSVLIDEARCRVACERLRRTDTTIKETAELLGFSEPSAFHRAFKRWTGRTPASYSRLKPQAEPQAQNEQLGRSTGS